MNLSTGNNFEFCLSHKITLKEIGKLIATLPQNNSTLKSRSLVKKNVVKRGGKQFNEQVLHPILKSGLEKEYERINIHAPVSFELKIDGHEPVETVLFNYSEEHHTNFSLTSFGIINRSFSEVTSHI